MKNISLLIIFATSTYCCNGQFFQATIQSDGNDLIFFLRANPGGGDITTSWSDTEFFVRWPDGGSAFNFGTITVNSSDFPGISIPNNGTNAQGSEVGFTNNWFGTSYSATPSSTYSEGIAYEIFRVTLDILAENVDFELVHNDGFFPHYLALIDGSGNDLSNSAGIVFYGDNAVICPSSNNCPVSTSGSNHVDKGFNAPLPVELITFRATKLANEILLDWQTASESNNMGFEVERSNNGREWEPIGFVEGKGSVSSLNEYQFIDSSPMIDINYYRLKQIDFDGAFEYSKVVNIEFFSDAEVQIYPNPTNGRIKMFGIETGNAKVMDCFGKLVKREEFSEPKLDISNFPSGVYFIQINSENQLITTRRIIKE